MPEWQGSARGEDRPADTGGRHQPGGVFKLAEPLVERALRREELEGNDATLQEILEARG